MENKVLELQKWLNLNKINFIKDFNLARRSWIKAGGNIKTYIKPNSLEDIKKINSYLKEKQIKLYIIGNISNIIIRDGEIHTPFVNLNSLNNIKKLKNKSELHIFVNAGVSIPVFSRYVLREGYTGTEGLYGIPGTVGGGIFMNASSFDDSLTKYIHKIVSIDIHNKIKIRKAKSLNFAWRYSDFQNNKEIILGAYFFFPKKNLVKKEIIEKKFKETITIRKKFQESDFPNLGSLFATKNIYSDIKFTSVSFLFMFIIYKFINFIFFKKILRNKYLSTMRRFTTILYLKLFKIDISSHFSLSDKSINCLINKGSIKSNEGITLIKSYQKITKNKIKLENIILDKIS